MGRDRKRSKPPQKKSLKKLVKMKEVKRRRLEDISTASTDQASGSSSDKSSFPSEMEPCIQSGNKSNLYCIKCSLF